MARTASCTNYHSARVSGDFFFSFRFSWECAQCCIIPRPRGSVLAACIHFAYIFCLSCWGRPLGCIIPKPLGLTRWCLIFLHLSKLICSFMLDLLMIVARRPPRVYFFLMRITCTLKGGRLSIATHGLLLALQPSPPGLDPRHCDLSYQWWLSSLEGRDLRT